MTLEEIEARHPELIPALRAHPHVGWLLEVGKDGGCARPRRSSLPHRRPDRGQGSARALLSDRGRAPPPDGRLRRRRGHHGRELLRTAARRGLRVRRAHLLPRWPGGPQTRPFILYPSSFAIPDEPIIGAASVHSVLRRWREQLQNGVEARVGTRARNRDRPRRRCSRHNGDPARATPSPEGSYFSDGDCASASSACSRPASRSSPAS